MRILLFSFVLAASVGAATPLPQAPARVAVVELFTSEGCSSCPPAEAYLGELAQRPDVLALAFHVDYWDGLGWRDRFVVPEATPRQRDYARSLGLSSVYTPQVVIDGTGNFVGSDRARIANALRGSRQGIPIEIAARDGYLEIGVGADVAARSDVLLVAFAQSAVSSIGRGENSGRTLTEYNIVRAMKRLGEYGGQAKAYRTDLHSLPKDATDVAVIVQTQDQGPVLGAVRYSLR